MRLHFFAYVILLNTSFGNELMPQEVIDQVDGLKAWITFADNIANEPRQIAIEKLGQGIRKTSKKSIYSIEGTIEVSNKLRESLIHIPGHADYYVNEIQKAKAAALSPAELQDRNGKISWAKYNQVRGEAFDTLEHLPSVETVKVLGSFLHDIEDSNDMTTHTDTCLTYGPGSNSGLATIALKILIDDAPIKTEDGVVALGEIEIWQKWFEQVKAGNRTFRFMGNSTDYDLNGPAPEEKLARIERDLKRDKERIARNRKSSLGSASASVTLQVSKLYTVAGIVAACTLLVGVVWCYMRGRETA